MCKVYQAPSSFLFQSLIIPSSGSDVYLDLTIFNPCDVILNFSYIVISVVIHNTNTQLMWCNQPVNVMLTQYNNATIKHLLVNVNEALMVINMKSAINILGQITTECYNFNGNIAMNLYNLQLFG